MEPKPNEEKKLGRPKNPEQDIPVNETTQDRLDMAQESIDEYISIDDLTKQWKNTFTKIAQMAATPGIGTVAAKWNKLNPFLQNQRIKEIYTRAKTYDRSSISKFLESPGNFERELRALGWANASSQQIL